MSWLGQAQDFMPHGMCLMWRPDLMALHIVSDALIALAYFAIPVSIAWFVRRRRDLEARHRMLAVLFAIFITLCGCTHIASIVVLWAPYYELEGAIKAATAVISVITAALLPFLVPQLLRIPSPVRLQAEIDAHRVTMAELEAARARLSAQVAATEGELRETTRRFETALRHSPVTVFEQDQSLAYTWAYNTPLGLDPERMVGRSDSELLSPESAEALTVLKREVIDAGEPRRVEMQVRIGEQAGWFDIYAEPISLRDGRRGLAATAADITQRKAHEAHLQVLMREMNHRAKNVLAIVVGIARQTAKGFDLPQDFTARLSERLASLASAHDVLASQEWRGADLEAVIQGQLRHHLDAYAQRIRLDGQPCNLPAEAAHYVGLALHELGSNAVKHGALSGDQGEVLVHWRVSGPAEAPRLELMWRETGGGRVEPPRRSGFGSTMLKTLVARATGGACQYEFLESGLEWRLQAPLPAELQA